MWQSHWLVLLFLQMLMVKTRLSGYIKEALAKGYVAGAADGKFHPKDPITFAQVCTAMVSVLGYTAQDVPGSWPKNYIEKANALKLTTDMTYNSNDGVEKWALVVMLNNLLDTNVKKNTAAEADKTLATASNLTTDVIYSVYSKPEIAKGFAPYKNNLGAISFSGNPAIVRNTIDASAIPPINNTGESITANSIKDNDVVYQVSDASNEHSYILVIDNKVSGKITSILPDKHSPKINPD